ncbi:DUF2695 domain-containing protein [Roseateles sp. PN1]|uniref:DUF2695 domain-containing protein n=1 Tax=Roseateles sp. PN1 TaxID=3137372 RepID=UPI0031399336
MKSSDRDLKKNWKLRQRELARAAFPVADSVLESLFDFVESNVDSQGCNHSLRFTTQWVSEHKQPEKSILEWLAAHGGNCDCEVVANAADHWEQNR